MRWSGTCGKVLGSMVGPIESICHLLRQSGFGCPEAWTNHALKIDSHVCLTFLVSPDRKMFKDLTTQVLMLPHLYLARPVVKILLEARSYGLFQE